jgi:hypothetical protein
MGRWPCLVIVFVFDDRVWRLSQASEHVLSRRSLKQAVNHPVPRGVPSYPGRGQVGFHFLLVQLDFHLPCKVYFHVFLSHLDPRNVQENHAVFLGHRWHTGRLLRLFGAQFCCHLSALWCRRRSVGPNFTVEVNVLTFTAKCNENPNFHKRSVAGNVTVAVLDIICDVLGM